MIDQLGWRIGRFCNTNMEILSPFGYGSDVNSETESIQASGMVTFCLIVDIGKLVQQRCTIFPKLPRYLVKLIHIQVTLTALRP